MYIAKTKIRTISKDGERILFDVGDEIEGITKKQAKELIGDGALEEVKTEQEKAK